MIMVYSMKQYITLSKKAQYIYNTNNHDIYKIYTPLKDSFRKKQNYEENAHTSNTQKLDNHIKFMIKTHIFLHNVSLDDDQYIEAYHSIITHTIFQINQWGEVKNISDKIIDLTILIMNAYPLKLLKSINNLKNLISDNKFTIMNIQLVYAEESTVCENLKKSTLSLYENKILCSIGTPTLIAVFRNKKFRYFSLIKYDIYSSINVHEETTYHSFNINNILKYN